MDNKDDFKLSELSVVRLYDLDFSNLKELIVNKEVLLLAYRYKGAGGVGGEYILLDRNTEYIYNVKKENLKHDVFEIFKNIGIGDYETQLCILNDVATEFRFYWITNKSLEFIFPNIELFNEEETSDKNYYSQESVTRIAKKLDEILSKNPIKKLNNVNFYFIGNEVKTNDNNLKMTYFEKFKRDGHEILTNKTFIGVFLGICIVKTFFFN